MTTTSIGGGPRLQPDRPCRQGHAGRGQEGRARCGWLALRHRPDPKLKKARLIIAGLCFFAGTAACVAALHAGQSLGPPVFQQAAHGNRQALQRIRQAATQGNTQAETELGALYAHGNGVPQNYMQAFSWYGKAAAQGDTAARHDLAALRRRLRRDMYR